MAAERIDCDLLVAGSTWRPVAGSQRPCLEAQGGGGRKEPVYGGTTAWSGGLSGAAAIRWLWRPASAGDPRRRRTCLRRELGANYDEARVEAFANAPAWWISSAARTALRFIDGNADSRLHGHSPGAATGRRVESARAPPRRRARRGDRQHWRCTVNIRDPQCRAWVLPL